MHEATVKILFRAIDRLIEQFTARRTIGVLILSLRLPVAPNFDDWITKHVFGKLNYRGKYESQFKINVFKFAPSKANRARVYEDN